MKTCLLNLKIFSALLLLIILQISLKNHSAFGATTLIKINPNNLNNYIKREIPSREVIPPTSAYILQQNVNKTNLLQPPSKEFKPSKLIAIFDPKNNFSHQDNQVTGSSTNNSPQTTVVHHHDLKKLDPNPNLEVKPQGSGNKVENPVEIFTTTAKTTAQTMNNTAGTSSTSSISTSSSSSSSSDTLIKPENVEVKFLVHKPGDEGIIQKGIIHNMLNNPGAEDSQNLIKFVKGPNIRVKKEQTIRVSRNEKKLIIYVLLKVPEVENDIKVIGMPENMIGNRQNPTGSPTPGNRPKVFLTYQ